jgi:hypothetical protein
VGALLLRFPSGLLRAVTATSVMVTMLAVGFQLAGGAAYSTLLYDPRPPVPATIETMRASRIVNLAGQPSGYYAMGRDYRHRVLTPFGPFSPADVQRANPEYLLLTQAQEAEYVRDLPLQLVARFQRANWPATSLWRLR